MTCLTCGYWQMHATGHGKGFCTINKAPTIHSISCKKYANYFDWLVAQRK